MATEGARGRLRERLEALVREARSGVLGVVVMDAESGQIFYEKSADEPLIPASNEKLFTTAAALGLLGPGYRVVTEVRARVEPVDGVVDEVFLIGAHDPSWSRLFGAPDAKLLELAASLRERGVRRVAKAAWVVGEPLWDAERGKELNLAEHRLATVYPWRRALEQSGIKVAAARSKESAGEGLPVALAKVSSEPLSRLIEPINQLSHNGFADALLRHLGLARGEGPARGPEALRGWLAGQGLDSPALHFSDGSGLSRANRVTARSIASLLAAAQRAPWASSFRGSLAVAGQKGTLATRMKGAAGKVLGKTGSLAEVVATSGLIEHAADRRTYVFALVSNGTRDALATRRLHDRIITWVASEWSAAAE